MKRDPNNWVAEEKKKGEKPTIWERTSFKKTMMSAYLKLVGVKHVKIITPNITITIDKKDKTDG